MNHAQVLQQKMLIARAIDCGLPKIKQHSDGTVSSQVEDRIYIFGWDPIRCEPRLIQVQSLDHKVLMVLACA